jgi:hypothetical protein
MKASTKEILALRVLNKTVDKRFVDWAISLLEKGCDTPHLRMLAGEIAPFNQFEMLELVDKVFKELNLSWSNQEMVIKDYVAELLKDMLNGNRSSSSVLDRLKRIYIELEDRFLQDFYFLWFAQEDLQVKDHQYYWPDTDRSNIDKKINEYAQNWLKENNT